MAALGGGEHPAHRLGAVARHAEALVEGDGDVELRDGVAGHGGAVEPGGGAFAVLLDTLAAQIHVGEVGLGAHQPLFGGAPVPVGGDREILRHAAAEAIEMAEIALREGVAVAGQRQPGLEGRFIVARVIGAHPGVEIGVRRRGQRPGQQEAQDPDGKNRRPPAGERRSCQAI
jgi:hypothetical protein